MSETNMIVKSTEISDTSKDSNMFTIDWDASSQLYHWPESSRPKTARDDRRSGICYTMPGLKSEEPLTKSTEGDPSKSRKFHEDHFGKLDLQLNQDGLTQLITDGEIERALNGTTSLLALLGQGAGKLGKPSHSSEFSLQLWAVRFQLMTMLNMHQQVVDELVGFEELDAPDLFYQYNPKSGRTGTMVPFSIRLLHAEILRFTPMPWKAIHRIKRLRNDVNWVISDLKSSGSSENTITMWNSRLLSVEKMHARVLYCLDEYSQAMEHLDSVKDAIPSEKLSLCLSMMRMAMSVGDEPAANKYLSEAATIDVNSGTVLTHKALRSIFLGAYPHAHDYTQRLDAINDTRPVVSNTAAITLLYTGKVQAGVQVLSKCEKPMCEIVLTNLKAMAELGISAAQKDTLMNQATKNTSVSV